MRARLQRLMEERGGEIVASMDLENAGDREVVRQGLRNESTVGCSSEIAKPENIQPIDFK